MEAVQGVGDATLNRRNRHTIAPTLGGRLGEGRGSPPTLKPFGRVTRGGASARAPPTGAMDSLEYGDAGVASTLPATINRQYLEPVRTGVAKGDSVCVMLLPEGTPHFIEWAQAVCDMEPAEGSEGEGPICEARQRPSAAMRAASRSTWCVGGPRISRPTSLTARSALISRRGAISSGCGIAARRM